MADDPKRTKSRQSPDPWDNDTQPTDEYPALDRAGEEEDEPALAEDKDSAQGGTEHRDSTDVGTPEDLSESPDEEGALIFGDGPVDSAGPTFVGNLPVATEPPGEKTEILPAQTEEPRQAVPVLTVESSEGTSSVEVVRERFVIGRAPDSDVVVPDQLVSRSHAVLEKRSDGWYLVDQHSGNGTFLNDERITDAQLFDGDVIRVGNADIVFGLPGAGGDGRPALGRTVMLPAAESTSVAGAVLSGTGLFARRRRFFLIIGSIVVFIGILGIVKKLTQKPPAPAGPTPEEVAATEYQAAVEEAQADFEKVKALVKENRFQEALPIILRVNEILGDQDLVAKYKETIELETAAEKAMIAAQARLAVEDFDQAMAELAKVSPASMQVEQASELKKQIETKRLAAKMDTARKALEAKEFEQVVTLADEILQIQPENQQASDMKRQAEAMLQKQKSVAASPRVKKPGTQIAPPPSLRSDTLLAGSALTAYRSGELDKAISVVGTSGVSAEGANSLRKFQKLYQRGLDLSSNPGQATQAEKYLSEAYALDKRLGGGKGKVTEDLQNKLAKVHFLKGVDAHNRRKYPEAFENYTKAQKFRPDLKQVQQRLEALEKEARKLYETAYVIKLNQPDKAISHCQTVMKMVKKDNYAYGRCQKLIQGLSGSTDSSGGTGDEGF